MNRYQLTPSPGRMGVDFETRVNFDRLRDYRITRARQALEKSDLGAVLLFDINNIRYVSSTMIGEWARDKMARFCLLPRNGEPIVWDFGSAAKHHKLYAPWIKPENSRAGMLGLRGSVDPKVGLFDDAVKEIVGILRIKRYATWCRYRRSAHDFCIAKSRNKN